MAEQLQSVAETGKMLRKRKVGNKKNAWKAKKKQKRAPFSGNKVKIDRRLIKLFEKRAREYNSDNEDEDDDGSVALASVSGDILSAYGIQEDDLEGEPSDDGNEDNEFAEDEDGAIQPGITKFKDGCKAFRLAFKKILKKSASDDILGPVLSAHKNLVAEKLAEEEEERKVKVDAKKIGEIGHVKPDNYLDSHEKFLIGVATKGVVKLFNAVNKAQHAQKGLNPSRSKDEKVIKKRRKDTFFSELGKRPQIAEAASKAGASSSSKDEGPSWAPLRDNYMLSNPKVKDWDTNQDGNTVSADSDSSDDD